MVRIPEALRRLVIERASGCCEYCRLAAADNFLAHEIDHIIAQKHRGTTTEDNLALSCFDCNRHKGSDIASIDPDTQHVVRLFNPRRDVWGDHFRLDGAQIVPLTAVGRVTEYVLKLNSDEQLIKRAALVRLGRYPG